MARSKTTAAFAALALIGASVFAGGLAANAAAQAPVIVDPVTATTSTDLIPTVSGTIPNPGVDHTVTVTVTNAAGTGVYCTDAVAYTETTWDCVGAPENFGLQYGDNTFVATATDTTDPGVVSPASNLVVVTVGGTQPVSIFAPATGETVHDSTPLFEGFGPTLGVAQVYLDGEVELCSAQIETSGYWNCESTVALTNFANTVAATATLVTGTPGEGFYGPAGLFYVPPPPTPVITGPTGDSYSPTATFTGTFPNDGSTYLIIVYAFTDSGEEICSDDVFAGDTTWSCAGTLLTGSTPYYAVAYPNTEGLETGNPSASSNQVTVGYIDTVPKPTMGYDLTPASIGITATGVPGSEVEVQFYSVITSGAAYDYVSVETCPAGGGGEGGGFGPTPVGCVFADLAPGVYNAYSHQAIDGAESGFQNDYVLIPSSPTLGADVNADRTVTFGGEGTPGYLVDVQTTGGASACTAIVTAAGEWTCDSAPTPGPHAYRATQQSQGFVADTGNPEDVPDASLQGYSALTAAVNVVVPAPPAPPVVDPPVVVPPDPAPVVTPGPTPTPTPTAPPVPLVWTFSAGGSEYAPGDETDLIGEGLPPLATVSAEFHSTPVALGATAVGTDGAFRLHVTIPEDATPGLHHFVVTVTPLGGAASTVEQAVTITPKPKAAGTPPSKSSKPLAVLGSAATGGERNDPAAPSSLTFSIQPFQVVLANPAVVGAAALAGLALLLLIAFPAELLNSTISEQYPRFSKRLPRVKTPWLERFTVWLSTTPVFGAILITLVASVIFGFSDPGFGFDITSLRLVLACFLALFVVGYLASSISGFIIRRRWGLSTVMELKPLGLLLTIVGVIISRLLDFSPGFLIGLLLGIAIVGSTTAAQRAKATLVQGGVVFVLAMLGWLLYSFVLGTTQPDSFGTALMFDTLVAVTAEGLTALFIGLLPFRYLDGESIFQYSKVIWAAAYALAAAAFVLIIVPSAWGEIDGPLWLWLAFIGGFAVIALALYLYFRFWAPPIEEDENETASQSVDA